MAGKILSRDSTGKLVKVTDPKTAVAYCRGRTTAKAGGTTLAKATVVTGVVGSNNSILFTPARYGAGFTVRLVDPKAASATLRVVTGGANSTTLMVLLATNSSSVITSTATEVIAAVSAAVSGLNILTSVANNGASTGAGVVAAQQVTSTGGTPSSPMGPATDAFVDGFGSWTASPSGVLVKDGCPEPYGGGFTRAVVGRQPREAA